MEPSYLSLMEFDRLLGIVSELAHSITSREAVLRITPLLHLDEILGRQGTVSEIMDLIKAGVSLRLLQFEDLAPLLRKVRPEGSVLEAAELSGFIPLLEIADSVSTQIREKDGLLRLKDLTSGLTGFPDIRRLLKRSVDSEGNILDSASSKLAGLRDEIRRLELRIRKRLEEMVRNESISVFLQDDFITKRSGRWVIPVRMDAKGQVAGVVHDVSKSGETAFIEPLAIIQTSNELENLIAEQKAEEIRILKYLSSLIRKSADSILDEYQGIVKLDMFNCIAVFGESLHMEIPEINLTGTIRLAEARHPILMLALRRTDSSREVVPLDVALGGDRTVMVITGSNAGGKTIAIKTIGLLLLMALSGMPVTARTSSSIPLVTELLADIGDEQSIDQNLSTFSAHISHISSILKQAGPGTLVLIDELGTGTDPDEGAALACAVLKELRERCGLVFATTHLSEIKGFVHRTEGMVNASMEFDQQTLTPLYRLRVGEPGQSHALETARRYGLPDHIIDSARALLGGVKVEFDNLVNDLNRKRSEYDTALGELAKNTALIEDKTRLLDRKIMEAEERHRELLRKAYQEAADIVLDTKKKMQSLIEELRKKDRAEAVALRKEVEAAHKAVSVKLKEFEVADETGPSIGEISEGEMVFAKPLGCDAEVVKVLLKERRVRVSTGSMEVELPVSELRQKKGRLVGKTVTEQVSFVKADEMPVLKLNLVGKRVDEALSRLEPFLNHAALAGLSEVTVIHGFGAGILSKAIREHLKGHPLIKGFRPGERNEGGDGVTIVTMV